MARSRPAAATRSGSPASRAAGSCTSGARPATRLPSGSAPRSPTIRHSPRASAALTRRRSRQRQPRRVIFDSLAQLPLNARLLDDAGEVAAHGGGVAGGSANGHRRAEGAWRRRDLCATGENEPARVRSALDQLGADGVTSVLLEGGPNWRARSWTRGDRRDQAVHRSAGARRPWCARPAGERGRRDDLRRCRSLTLDCDRIGDDLLVTARIREW